MTASGGPALSVDGGGAIVAATVLGRGPVAVVYAGRLAATGAEVAVKVFPDRFDRDTATRFDRERRALAAVASVPSILAVESVGEYSGDRSSVITQLCAGSLAGMLTRGALPVSEVLAVGAAVAGALAAAHEAGVVHGGVTPHNVLFRRSGEPVLGDFGLALRERFSRDPMHALEYTSPETLRDDTRTTASDLYGLGAVLYAMLTGAPPFPRRTGQAPGERILRVLRDPVPPIQAIPGELSELVSLLLAKDPTSRPADAARVAAWFDHVRGRGTAVPPALNPLAPPAAHPDTDFDSFAGRPETGPPQHFPAPPVAAPPVAALPLAPLQPAITQQTTTEPTHPRPTSPPPANTQPPGQTAPPAPTQPPATPPAGDHTTGAQPSIHAAITQPSPPATPQPPPSQLAGHHTTGAQPPSPAAFPQPPATPPAGDHTTGTQPSIHAAISQVPPPQLASPQAPITQPSPVTPQPPIGQPSATPHAGDTTIVQPPSPAAFPQPPATPPAGDHTTSAHPNIHAAISQAPPPQLASTQAPPSPSATSQSATSQPAGDTTIAQPPSHAAFPQPPGGGAAITAAPPPGRTLVYSVSGQQTAQKPRRGRWKIVAGVGVLLVAAGVAAVVVTSGGETPAAQQEPPVTTSAAPETTAVPDIGLEVTKVDDLGDRVELTWSAEGDLDFSVVVAGEKIDTMVLVANRQREMTVPVDPGRKYCFQIRATDSREIYTSEPVPIRGARCAL